MMIRFLKSIKPSYTIVVDRGCKETPDIYVSYVDSKYCGHRQIVKIDKDVY